MSNGDKLGFLLSKDFDPSQEEEQKPEPKSVGGVTVEDLEPFFPSLVSQAASGFVKGATLGQLDPGIPISAQGVHIAGQVAGEILPFTKAMGLARRVMGLSKSAVQTMGVLQRMKQGAIGGAAIGAVRKIDDDKSRVSSILEEAALFSAFEGVAGGLGKMWKLLRKKPGSMGVEDEVAAAEVVSNLPATAQKSLNDIIEDYTINPRLGWKDPELIGKATDIVSDRANVLEHIGRARNIFRNPKSFDKFVSVVSGGKSLKSMRTDDLKKLQVILDNEVERQIRVARKGRRRAIVGEAEDPDLVVTAAQNVLRKSLKDIEAGIPKLSTNMQREMRKALADEDALASLRKARETFDESLVETEAAKFEQAISRFDERIKETKELLSTSFRRTAATSRKSVAEAKPTAKRSELEKIATPKKERPKASIKGEVEAGVSPETRAAIKAKDNFVKSLPKEQQAPAQRLRQLREERVSKLEKVAELKNVKPLAKVLGVKSIPKEPGKLQSLIDNAISTRKEAGKSFDDINKSLEKHKAEIRLAEIDKLEKITAQALPEDVKKGLSQLLEVPQNKKPPPRGETLTDAAGEELDKLISPVREQERKLNDLLARKKSGEPISGGEINRLRKDLSVRQKLVDDLLNDPKNARFAVGSIAGVQTDDDGNLIFDWKTGLAGMAMAGMAFHASNNKRFRDSLRNFFKDVKNKVPKDTWKAREEFINATKTTAKKARQSADEVDPDIFAAWEDMKRGGTGKLDAIKAHISSGLTYFSKGKFGKQFVNAVNSMDDFWKQESGKYRVRLNEATKGFSKKDWEALKMGIEGDSGGRITPDVMALWEAPKMKRAIAEVKSILKEIGDQAEGLGILAGKREDYWPHIFDFKKIKQDPRVFQSLVKELRGKFKDASDTEIEAWVKDHLGKETLGNTPVEKAAAILRIRKGEMTLEEAKRAIQNYTSQNTRRIVGNLERRRELNLFAGRLDPEAELRLYIGKSTRSLAEVGAFGKNLEKADDIIRNMKLNGEDGVLASKYLERILLDTLPEEKALKGLLGKAKSMQVVTKLGLASMLNISEPINLFAVASFKSVAKGLERTMAGLGKDKTTWNMAERAGALMDDIAREAFAISDQGVLGGLAENVLKYTGFTAQEKFFRVWGYHTGKYYAPEVAAKFMANQGSKRWRLSLEELGIAPSDLIRQNGKLTASQIDLAGKRLADYVFKRGRTIDLPLWTSTPWGSLFFQFKRFAFGQGRLLKNELFVKKNPKAWAMVAAVYPLVGEAVGSARSLVSGYDRPDNLPERYVDNLAWLGSFGIFYDMVKNARYKQGLAGYFAGPTVGDLSEISSSMYSSVAKGDPTPFLKYTGKQFPVLGRTALIKKLSEEKKKRRGRKPTRQATQRAAR